MVSCQARVVSVGWAPVSFAMANLTQPTDGDVGESGREGDLFVVGFSPRATALEKGASTSRICASSIRQVLAELAADAWSRRPQLDGGAAGS
jgi:hypothetical protein